MKCYPPFSHTRDSRNCVRTSTIVLATLLITNQFFWLLTDSSINLQRLRNENQFETLVLYSGCKRVSCGVSAFGQVFVVTQAKHWVANALKRFMTWSLARSHSRKTNSSSWADKIYEFPRCSLSIRKLLQNYISKKSPF